MLDLIASRIPPGPGPSRARNNDSVWCLGALGGVLDAFGGASGRPPGVSGRPPGGVFGALGGILVALAAKKPSRAHKDAPKSPQGLPKKEENGTGAPHFGVSEGPKMNKNQYK